MIWHVTLHFSKAGMENQGFRGLSLLPPDEAPLPLARKRKRPLAMPAAGSVDAERRPQARASGSAGILRPERRVLREQGSGPRPEHRVLREEKDRLGRLGHVRPGPVGLDAVRLGSLGSARLGSFRFRSVRVRSGPARLGSIRFGQAWFGSLRFGSFRPGSTRFVSVCWVGARFVAIFGRSDVGRQGWGKGRKKVN